MSPGIWFQPETGRSSKLIPKINTSNGPIKKVGTHIPIIAIAIGMKSNAVFLLRAAKTPEKTPITSAINIAYIASSKVIGSPVKIISVTDRPGYLNDGPKSP